MDAVAQSIRISWGMKMAEVQVLCLESVKEWS